MFTRQSDDESDRFVCVPLRPIVERSVNVGKLFGRSMQIGVLLLGCLSS